MSVKNKCLQAVSVKIPFSHGILVVSWLKSGKSKSRIGNSFDELRFTGQSTRSGVGFLRNGVVFMFVTFLVSVPTAARGLQGSELTLIRLDHFS